MCPTDFGKRLKSLPQYIHFYRQKRKEFLRPTIHNSRDAVGWKSIFIFHACVRVRKS